MGRPKGTEKTGGRKKGTPNKSSGENRQLLTAFIFDDFEQFKEDFSKLTERERVDAKIKMLPFVVPRLANIESTVDLNIEKLSDEQVSEIIETVLRSEY